MRTSSPGRVPAAVLLVPLLVLVALLAGPSAAAAHPAPAASPTVSVTGMAPNGGDAVRTVLAGPIGPAKILQLPATTPDEIGTPEPVTVLVRPGPVPGGVDAGHPGAQRSRAPPEVVAR
ncbi:hypothetical protein ACVGVM_23560 [Pseudonocardia bannensis]|uniref:Uncharacterized protein n=1 Tax=Pseudonocardia bannensis TaxID=630973 RepID=A0A848DLJ2_9PSEU|nr:hypothetical protein [Pseudonocardia bannensis]NMH93413.1 hypothetical protein [Pseudonocardia bannensis]